MSDDDKFTKILEEMVTLRTTVVKVLEPAASQAYTNKEDIASMRWKIKIGQYVTGGFVVAIIKSVY
jgi:hypothetical protein